MADHLFKEIGIVDHAGHQLAGLFIRVEAQREFLQMLVYEAAGTCHDTPAGNVRRVGAHILH